METSAVSMKNHHRKPKANSEASVCGNAIADSSERAQGKCTVKCAGDSGQACGGPNQLSLYDYNMKYPINAVLTTARYVENTL